MMSLTVRDVNRAYLARQHLLARADSAPLPMIRQLIALQAQAHRPPYTALWNRLQHISTGEIDALAHARVTARVVTFRSTIHLIAADEVTAVRELLQPLVGDYFPPAWRQALAGVDLDAVVRRGIEHTTATPLTYAALGALLAQEFDTADAPNAGGPIQLLAQVLRSRAPMIAVPPSLLWGDARPGRYQPTATWLGELAGPPIDDPAVFRAGLACRYLAAYGPATAADLTTFTGVSGWPATLTGLADELVVLDGPAGPLVDLPDAPRPGGDVAAPVRLMAEWDSALLAHRDRSRITPEAQRRTVYTKNGVMPATVLVDGFVAGTWSWRRRGKRAELAICPLTRWPKSAVRQAEREALSYLHFAAPDLRPEVLITPA